MTIKFILLLLLAITAGFFAGKSFNNHDQLISSQQDTDKPIMATTLEDSAYPRIKIASNVVHNLGVQTAIVIKGDLPRNIETLGKITRVDPMARRTLTPPIRGELVFVADKQEGGFVKPGELLFAVSSESLLNLQKSFQDAYFADEQMTVTAMLTELRRLGLRPEQITALQNGAEPKFPVEVYADEDGYIFTSRGIVGESVHEGFTIFNVGGQYRVIEVTAEIFERQWDWVKNGQQANMSVRGLPGEIFSGQVVRVEPPVGYTTRSLEVALRFNTEHLGLSQSMFAHVSILGQAKENILLVPQQSVIRVGNEQRVVLQHQDGSFQSVVVTIGEESEGMLEILSGLQENDKVVTSGQFLIDSESNLMADLKRMSPADKQIGDIMDHHHHH